ncbi:MAG: transcriptional regulator-like protein [Candidatus Bathyarchaeota archaeon B26-2]|nr:MAG: transcriptional regulator-like protein [Candidatus Bathyarchaeota archaeon B26-2]
MYPACEAVARYILPVFRSLVAKKLIEDYNFTQLEAAKRLGTTQAAISQYIHSKRGYKSLGEFRDALPEIQSAATETARRIATEKIGKEEVMSDFCRLCISLREKGKFSTK